MRVRSGLKLLIWHRDGVRTRDIRQTSRLGCRDNPDPQQAVRCQHRSAANPLSHTSCAINLSGECPETSQVRRRRVASGRSPLSHAPHVVRLGVRRSAAEPRNHNSGAVAHDCTAQRGLADAHDWQRVKRNSRKLFCDRGPRGRSSACAFSASVVSPRSRFEFHLATTVDPHPICRTGPCTSSCGACHHDTVSLKPDWLRSPGSRTPEDREEHAATSHQPTCSSHGHLLRFRGI